METIEIRCPVGPKRLLSKLLSEGGKPHIVPGNLIEFSCDDCKRTVRRTDPTVLRVLHRYNLAGTLAQSIKVMPGDRVEEYELP